MRYALLSGMWSTSRRGINLGTGLLGKVKVGGSEPVAVMGVINLSSDSFFRGSVVRTDEVLPRAREMVEEGAKIVDVGAMATGPRSSPVPQELELKLLIPAVKSIAKELDVTVSVDTQRSEVAAAAISAGASVVNDVTGLKGDLGMVEVLKRTGSSAILMAARRLPGDVLGIAEIKNALRRSLDICSEHGVSLRRVAVDPAVGHWPGRLARLNSKKSRGGSYTPATSHDLEIIARLEEFRTLGRPLCVGISRKSFVGEILEKHPDGRLCGSLAGAAIAVLNGASIIRTHDVKETVEAVRVAEAIRNAG
ncbi:MAG: dihydropteroate synthase [Candidatus Hadarchaeales archaeon]